MATIKMIENWLDENTGDRFAHGGSVATATRSDGRIGISVQSRTLDINGIVDNLDGEVEITGISCYAFVEQYAHKIVEDLELGVVKIVYLSDFKALHELSVSTFR